MAMAIFTSMLVLAGAALNQGLRQYQGLVEKGIGFWDYAKIIWIDKSFNSITDYYVYNRSDRWFPYFRGVVDGVSYVSLAPFAGEFPVVVWIKVEAQPDGKQTLRYYELPVYTRDLADIERHEVFGDYKKGHSFDLLQDAEGITFNYFGCDVFTQQCRWTNRYEGNRMHMLPASVKIEFSQKGEKGSLIFNTNVNDTSKISYNDIYGSR